MVPSPDGSPQVPRLSLAGDVLMRKMTQGRASHGRRVGLEITLARMFSDALLEEQTSELTPGSRGGPPQAGVGAEPWGRVHQDPGWEHLGVFEQKAEESAFTGKSEVGVVRQERVGQFRLGFLWISW